MATRYWVGGSGTWNTTATTNWSATSGGASGASVPTSADDVVFDANSNVGTRSFTVALSGAATCKDFTVSGLDGAMNITGASTPSITIAGNLSVPATNFTWGITGGITFANGSGGFRTITTSGIPFTSSVTFNRGITDWALQDDMTVSDSKSTTINNGTLNLNGYNLSTGTLIYPANTATSGRLTSGGGSIYLTTTTAGATALNMPTVYNAGFGPYNFYFTDQPNIYTDASVSKVYRFGSPTSPPNLTSTYLPNIFFTGSGSSNISLNGYYKNLDFGSVSSTVTSGGVNLRCVGFTLASGGVGTYSAIPFVTPNELSGDTGVMIGSGQSVASLLLDRTDGGTTQLDGGFSVIGLVAAGGTNGTTTIFNASMAIGSFSSTSSATRNITISSGVTLSVGGDWAIDSTGLTFTATGSTISMNDTGISTFAGSGLTYGTINMGGNGGTLTISGNNTFENFTNTTTTACTIQLTASSTQTFTQGFSLSGTAGNLITLTTTSVGTRATVSKASGRVDVSYLAISWSAATGGAYWSAPYTAGNTQGTSVTGWAFSGSSFLAFFNGA